MILNDSVMVSISICTYNHERFIGEAIKSILNQNTDYRYEIIIGDDASTDCTPDIIRHYASLYPDKIIPVLRERNIGATYNSYDIARRERGKYGAGLDGDDCWDDSERLQKQVDFLEAHPEYSAIAGKCRLIDDEGNPLGEDVLSGRAKFWEFNDRVFEWDDFENWEMPGHVSAIMGRNPWLKHDAKIMYEAHDMVGDRTGVLLYLLDGPIYCSDEIVSCYRIHENGNNFMAKYQSQNLRDKEVHMMLALEEYAASRGRKLNLSRIKKNRLVGAMAIFLKTPSAENKNVVENILRETTDDPEYLRLSLKTVLQKLYDWNVLHEDNPIEIG